MLKKSILKSGLFFLLALLLCAQVVLPSISHAYQKYTIPFFFPGVFAKVPALVKIQYAMEHVRDKEIEAKRKAGEPVYFSGIEVTSQPAGAGVLVSSYVPLGATPFNKGEILVGRQRVTVRKEGYYDEARMVDIKRDKVTKEHFLLKPIPYARLTLKLYPHDAKARVIGLSHKYHPGMKLVPGEYLAEIKHPRYGRQRLYIGAAPDQEITLTANLRAQHGGLDIRPRQKGVTVYVDGEEVRGDRLKPGNLIPGPHKL